VVNDLYKERMVAVLDILGFSTLLKERSLEDIVAIYRRLFVRALHYAIHKKDAPADLRLDALAEEAPVGIAWFSDTVFVYSRSGSPHDLRVFMEVVAWMLFFTVFDPKIRLRCGIAYGRVYTDEANRLYFGQPFADAHDLEARQQWSGGALTDSARRALPPGAVDIHDFYLTEYDVPVKDGTERLLAVDWTRGIHDPTTFPWSPASPEPTAEDLSTPDMARKAEKWRNTRRFHSDVCKFCAGKS
jgi:hypothetical protein